MLIVGVAYGIHYIISQQLINVPCPYLHSSIERNDTSEAYSLTRSEMVIFGVSAAIVLKNQNVYMNML